MLSRVGGGPAKIPGTDGRFHGNPVGANQSKEITSSPRCLERGGALEQGSEGPPNPPNTDQAQQTKTMEETHQLAHQLRAEVVKSVQL